MEDIVSYCSDCTKPSRDERGVSAVSVGGASERIMIRWELSTLAFPRINSEAIDSNSDTEDPSELNLVSWAEKRDSYFR